MYPILAAPRRCSCFEKFLHGIAGLPATPDTAGSSQRLSECYIRTRAARTRRNIFAWLFDSDKRVAVIKRTDAPLPHQRSSLLFYQWSFRSANIALVINFPRDSTRVPGINCDFRLYCFSAFRSSTYARSSFVTDDFTRSKCSSVGFTLCEVSFYMIATQVSENLVTRIVVKIKHAAVTMLIIILNLNSTTN